jgi:hypothetical protein
MNEFVLDENKRDLVKIFFLLLIFFGLWGYHDIGTKFPPPLAMTNLRRGICGAPKVGSPLPTEFA